ncbi:DNA-binding protein [Candidatus Parcubacteria bacterium]|nr:MAG: DNA-binding protein [Candidatus Parcubacteria bacterium]
MTQQTTTSSAYITIPEAADLLRVSQRTVYRWIKEGKLPCFHIGNVTRIAQQDLFAFIQKHSNTGDNKHGPAGS